MILQIENAGFSFGAKQVLTDLTFSVAAGEFVGIAGLNGSGKTTLLKMIQRIYRPSKGRLLLSGIDLQSHSSGDLARLVASVPQRAPLSFDFTAREFVMLGRTPYLNFFKHPSTHDEKVVEEAMRRSDCLRFANTSVLQISAGELQRVCIALALAQEPEILLLDEPTSALDILQRSRLSRLLLDLHQEGMTVLCASHDLSFLRKHATKMLLLNEGRLFAFGQPDNVLCSANLAELFEMKGEMYAG